MLPTASLFIMIVSNTKLPKLHIFLLIFTRLINEEIVRKSTATFWSLLYWIDSNACMSFTVFCAGSKYQFNVIMETCDGKKTKQSNTVTVTCPRHPDAIQLNLDEMNKEQARITWHGIKGKHVTSYL